MISQREQVKIVGAGFARTGTTSLKVALELLGFKCNNMKQLTRNNSQLEAMADILSQTKEQRMKNKAWNNLLFIPYEYTAVVCWPFAHYYQEILHENPSAKVILTVRDSPEVWYKSVYSSIFLMYQNGTQWPCSLLLNLMFAKKVRKGRWYSIQYSIWENRETFDGKFADKQRSIDIYNDWIASVRAFVPKEQLLILNVRQGWKPLCDFLNVDIPAGDGMFPRTASTQEVVEFTLVLRFINFSAKIFAYFIIPLLFACFFV